MATEQPLWRGKTRFIGSRNDPNPDRSWFVGGFAVDAPPDHDIVVLSASHYDALVDQAENQLPDAQLDAEGWEKEARKAEERVAELTDAIRGHAEVCVSANRSMSRFLDGATDV